MLRVLLLLVQALLAAAQLERWTAISTQLQFCLQQVPLQRDRMLHFQVDDLFDLARVPGLT